MLLSFYSFHFGMEPALCFLGTASKSWCFFCVLSKLLDPWDPVATASYLRVPVLVLSCPFFSVLLAGCWVSWLLRSSFAKKYIYAAWLNIYVLSDQEVYIFQSFAQPVRKHVSSDRWAGHPCSTFEQINQKIDRHLQSFKLLCKPYAVHICLRILCSLLWKWIILFPIIQFMSHLLTSDLAPGCLSSARSLAQAAFCWSISLSLPHAFLFWGIFPPWTMLSDARLMYYSICSF